MPWKTRAVFHNYRPTGAFSKSSRYQLVWFQHVLKLIIAILFGELDGAVCHPQWFCRSGSVWEWYRTAKIREVIRRIDLEVGLRDLAPSGQKALLGHWARLKLQDRSELGVLIPVEPPCRARLDLVWFPVAFEESTFWNLLESTVHSRKNGIPFWHFCVTDFL